MQKKKRISITHHRKYSAGALGCCQWMHNR